MVASEERGVELCADGYDALDILTGNEHYHLLLIDNDSPGLSGLELISDCESEAWGAGVNVVLKSRNRLASSHQRWIGSSKSNSKAQREGRETGPRMITKGMIALCFGERKYSETLVNRLL